MRLTSCVALLIMVALALPACAEVGEGESAVAGKRMNPGPLFARVDGRALPGRAMAEFATLRKPAMQFRSGLKKGQRLGFFEIPRLGVKEWIVHGSEKEDLVKGAGHIVQTSIPGLGGNFGVAGDRVLYSAPLLRADLLTQGDEILVEMPYARFTYRVESITTVIPEDVGVLKPRGYESITLSTCDPPWGVDTRIIISGRITSAEPKA